MTELASIEGFKELLPASLSLVQAVPISLLSVPSGGILVVGVAASGQWTAASSADGEVLEALAEHIAIALEQLIAGAQSPRTGSARSIGTGLLATYMTP